MNKTKEPWFEWKENAAKPVAIHRIGKVVLYAPFVIFVIFILSIPVSQNLNSHPYWIMDSLFSLFALSFFFKIYSLFTRTRARKTST